MTQTQEVRARASTHPRPAWRLVWLTPARCRIILAALLLFDVLAHLHYLHHDCPIDLSGDEAQYWDWSRHLDLSYYSKGPLIAYIIHASTALFGNSMQAVRYPALLIGAATSLVNYLLTGKLFGSERLALGSVLLTHLVPMFIAGSVLMTIDPPMFLCWALACLFAAYAIFDGRKWAWPALGVAVGIGFLGKYATMLFLPALGLYLAADSRSRGFLRTPWPFVASLIALLFTMPVLIWNSQHGWVSFHHVATQTGATGSAETHGNFLEFIGSQIGAVGPVIFALLIVAIAHALRLSSDAIHRSQLLFLALIGAFFFGLNAVVSFVAKVQVNWPAPAYFTLLILAAYYISTRLRSIESWRPWRPWFWGTVAVGILAAPILHDPSLLFPGIGWFNRTFGTHLDPVRLDPSYRLRGWRQLGARLSELRQLHPDAFILCDSYDQTAEASFYTDGHPDTFCVGAYYTKPKRLTQYDVWPDRRLDQPALLGRTAIFVGKSGGLPPEIARAFARIQTLPELPIVVRGVTVRTFHLYLGEGFRGMKRSVSVSY
jgi:4-amino-4-deoxy-L-arabinose transferase-like glycosyltransferase